ncbi:autotransporter outer membrane beta-barrel domain-containing protein [Breoghania sp.]|uniref:autotransporter outer membrane beta-barrel domain-containing protein n=1 Tax=Breoghania sp. TaxID=2065378 RepID=UPI002AA816E6|nr:autotransporter outer membrane beta-barrel domain-containing protein [Breoghania sp.]
MSAPRKLSLPSISERPQSLRDTAVAGICAAALSLGLCSAALADNISTMDTWDGDHSLGEWGAGYIATFGQTITVDSDTTLYGFSFELKLVAGTASQYQAYVYEWDSSTSTVTGDALYVSAVRTAPNSSAFTTVTINTGSTALSSGKTYVIFLTTSTVSGQSSGRYYWGAVAGASYADGSYISLDNNEDATALTTSSWSPVINFDLAFTAILEALGAEGGYNAVGMQLPSQRLTSGFLTVMLNPVMPSRQMPNINPLGYADSQSTLSDDEKSAFATALHGKPESTGKPMIVWGSAYGGYNRNDGGEGGYDSQSRSFGMASGIDYWLSPETTVGFALGIGRMSWDVEAGNGGGTGNILQGGLYGRHTFGPAYLAGALSASYQDTHTERTSSGAILEADYNAFNIGARIEAGYNLASGSRTVFTPYGALQAQWLHTPSYSESGTSALTLGFEENNTVATRTEIGLWINKTFTLDSGKPFSLFGRLGWAHNFDTDVNLQAAFQSVSGSDFTVAGSGMARNLALVTLGGEFDLDNGWSMTAKLDGELGSRSQTYQASGRIAYRW